MNKPKTLDAEAAAFWKRHAKRLEDHGLLTDATYDSFVLLCRTHSILAQHDPNNAADKMAVIKFVALTKIYQAIAKGFGMNSDKVKAIESAPEPDEFGIG